MTPKVLVLCAIETGWDSVVSVFRGGVNIAAVVGLDFFSCDYERISGAFDAEEGAAQLGIPFVKAKDYSLRGDEDRAAISNISYDIVWVAGWQRLVPDWLIGSAPMGVLGIHGSPDGISGGRGRSPQNWALLLDCARFDIALFMIEAGVDSGPVILERSFFYNNNDDIRISYYKASLLVSEMVLEVLQSPEKINSALPQKNKVFYFPQRLPQDGAVDWSQPSEVISRHCRALTKPYPGLRTRLAEVELRIWQCQRFDDRIDGVAGQVSAVFYDGCFLVSCADGRLLVRSWSADKLNWMPVSKDIFESIPLSEQFSSIVSRHRVKYPDQPISDRILRLVPDLG